LIASQLLEFAFAVILLPLCGCKQHEGLVGVIREMDSIDLRLKLRKIRFGGKMLMISFTMFSLWILVNSTDFILNDFNFFYFYCYLINIANWLILECLVLQFTLFIKGCERRFNFICRKLNSITKVSELIELCIVHHSLTGVCDRANKVYSLRLLYLMTATFIMVVEPPFFVVMILRNLTYDVMFVIYTLIMISWTLLSGYELLQVVQICSSTTKKAGHLKNSLIFSCYTYKDAL
jgi:hypothetical protein